MEIGKRESQSRGGKGRVTERGKWTRALGKRNVEVGNVESGTAKVESGNVETQEWKVGTWKVESRQGTVESGNWKAREQEARQGVRK